LALFMVSCQCGGGLCDAVKCKTGFTCDPMSGVCKEDHAGGGSGGGGAASSGGGTASSGGGTASSGGGTASSGGGTASSGGGNGGGAAATCEPACSGTTPFCDTSGASPQCIQCRTPFDCTQGLTCDPGSHTCVTDTGTGGSSGTGGGTSSGSGGGTGSVPVTFDDAGMSMHCLQTSGPAQCTTECSRGYECVGGQCQLRGSGGPVQITLRWNLPEDLDLHVVEPLPDGGGCDIYYGDPGRTPDAGPITIGGFTIPPPPPSRCGAIGWLDLDSNPACQIDNVDTENVIYPNGGVAPSGHFIVRVDYYEACGSPPPIPYEVEVRANGQTQFYCGTFDPSESDSGGDGSGRYIAGFTVP
jgi:hypothetical protein